LNPEDSPLDLWIFEAPCFSATKIFSVSASAMKNHIVPLIKKHEYKLFNFNLAMKIIDQEYNFENDIDENKIDNSYFYENQQIFWKKIKICL
jgi:hypothetical protein